MHIVRCTCSAMQIMIHFCYVALACCIHDTFRGYACHLLIRASVCQRHLTMSSIHDCAGSVWHTLIAFGSNFDTEGFYSYRRLSWPSTFWGTSVQDLADADFYQCGSREAYSDLFRAEGKAWATLRDLAAAHAHFKEIKETGVLGIFPFGQGANSLKASRHTADTRLSKSTPLCCMVSASKTDMHACILRP